MIFSAITLTMVASNLVENHFSCENKIQSHTWDNTKTEIVIYECFYQFMFLPIYKAREAKFCR
jgi:hypothetical protein